MQTSVPFTIWDVLWRMGSPRFLGKDKGAYASSPLACGAGTGEKGGLCVWRSRHPPRLCSRPHLARAHVSSCPYILRLSILSIKSCCIFYAARRRGRDADFHSYRRGGRNGKDKLGHLRVCSCEIHFKIAALQA